MGKARKWNITFGHISLQVATSAAQSFLNPSPVVVVDNCLGWKKKNRIEVNVASGLTCP